MPKLPFEYRSELPEPTPADILREIKNLRQEIASERTREIDRLLEDKRGMQLEIDLLARRVAALETRPPQFPFLSPTPGTYPPYPPVTCGGQSGTVDCTAESPAGFGHNCTGVCAPSVTVGDEIPLHFQRRQD